MFVGPEGANNRHQREQEKKKHHSCDGIVFKKCIVDQIACILCIG